MIATVTTSHGKAALGLVALTVIAVASFAVMSGKSGATEAWKPVPSITHAFQQNHLHGLAYVPEVGGLYLATHYGLFLLRDGQLYQVGDSRDDYMGFSSHPEDPGVFLSSGHARMGGNLGVMISRDGGATWRRLLGGVGDEIVDFHAMVVSPAKPDRLYGVHQGRFYVGDIATDDWTVAAARGINLRGHCWGAPCLAAAPDHADRVFAATSEGVHVTGDGGESWREITTDTDAVAGIAVHPGNADILMAHTEAYGVAVSEDGGESWQSRERGLVSAGDLIFDFAFDPTTPGRVFAATARGHVFESTDLGRTWQSIMTAQGPS